MCRAACPIPQLTATASRSEPVQPPFPRWSPYGDLQNESRNQSSARRTPAAVKFIKDRLASIVCECLYKAKPHNNFPNLGGKHPSMLPVRMLPVQLDFWDCSASQATRSLTSHPKKCAGISTGEPGITTPAHSIIYTSVHTF